MTKFSKNGRMFQVIDEKDLDFFDPLPPATYTVKFHPITGYYLEEVDSFTPIEKYYGDTLKHSERILRTFEDRPNSTGVLLVGEKGSGKTLLAKTVSLQGLKKKIPTILVLAPFCGEAFNTFIQKIDQPLVIIFDEFEKVYPLGWNDEDGDSKQEQILTLLDGVFPSKKLFILTCNNKYKINLNMLNRPGRLFYHLTYTGIPVEFIEQYCNDKLKNKDYIRDIQLVSKMFYSFNFDMLQALVEEVNRYDEPPKKAIQMLNIKPDFNTNNDFIISVKKENITVELEHDRWQGNPLHNNVTVQLMQTNFLHLIPENIKKFDFSIGVVSYEKDGYEITLTKVKERQFTYDDIAF